MTCVNFDEVASGLIGVCGSIFQDEAAVAVAAGDVSIIAHFQKDARMTKGPAIAVAAHTVIGGDDDLFAHRGT